MESHILKMSHFCLLVFLLTAITITVESAGLGEQMLWASDTGHLEIDSANKDALFQAKRRGEGQSDDGGTLNDELLKQYKQVMRKVKIDIVAPSKDLSGVMNMLVTKAKAKYLTEYEHYYKEMEVDTITRPMLYTYICLGMLGQEQIREWYEPIKRRAAAKVSDSCKSLADYYRKQVSKLEQSDLDIVSKAKADAKSSNQLAYAIFQTNLNLFMINNYLILCARLDSQQMDQQITWLL